MRGRSRRVSAPLGGAGGRAPFHPTRSAEGRWPTQEERRRTDEQARQAARRPDQPIVGSTMNRFLNSAHVVSHHHGLTRWNKSPMARNGATRSPAAHGKMCRPVAINPLFFSRYRLCETKRLCGLARDVIGVFLEGDVKRQTLVVDNLT